uniref:Tropomyosin n=1 Tax=Schistosoma haematobium TaxID=6185 RepID=A0A094ZGG4_SCHHA
MISAKLSDLHDNIAKLSHELDLKRKEKESQRSFVKKLDSEIKDKHRFLDSLEQKREQHEKTIRVNTERLCELQKSAAECQKAHESLEKRLESQEQSIRSLEDEVNEAQSLARSSAQVYDETLKLLQEKLEVLEKYDRKEESLTKTIKELRDEANLHGNRLRRIETQGNEVRCTWLILLFIEILALVVLGSGTHMLVNMAARPPLHANKRIEMLEEKIRELTEQINSATQRAVRAEEESENLAGELTILEDEANEWNEKSSNVQEQINMKCNSVHSE